MSGHWAELESELAIGVSLACCSCSCMLPDWLATLHSKLVEFKREKAIQNVVITFLLFFKNELPLLRQTRLQCLGKNHWVQAQITSRISQAECSSHACFFFLIMFYVKPKLYQLSAADVKMEIPVLAWSVKSSILSSTSLQILFFIWTQEPAIQWMMTYTQTL